MTVVKKPLTEVVQKASEKAVDKPMTKQQALDALVDLKNSDKVMNSKSFTNAKDLLKISCAAGDYPYTEKMKTKDYENEKRLLQIELLKVQKWLKDANKKKLSRSLKAVTQLVKVAQ